MNILIVHPDLKSLGGVSSYIYKLKKHFKIPINYFTVGKRLDEKGKISGLLRLFFDYYKFILIVKKKNIDIIHLNPTLDFNSFFRDGIFVIIGKLFGKKVIVFFRGWRIDFELFITNKGLRLFTFFYGRTDIFIVLSDKFRNTLKQWGITQSIVKEVTIIDDDTINDFDLDKGIEKRLQMENFRILFLARIIREKGIYETIKSFSLLKSKYPEIELIIAGDGKELNQVKSFVQQNLINNITFTGYINGKDKIDLLNNTHILFFPSYSEGLPNAVIESMAFGLPVVTRPVGGLTDFFKNGENGFFTITKDPKVFADLIGHLIINKELYKRIAQNNYNFALSNFLASKAAIRLQKIYDSIEIDN